MLRRLPDWGAALLARQATAARVGLFTPLRGVRHNRHDSCSEELASRYFDLQDVPADRLTHHYWDDVDSPYDGAFLLDEFPLAEGGGDNEEHVLQPDRRLLSQEYL
ncbi:uncharacterized protein Tco025E_01574 [Trypanosoma conorhini]|uniref:Uncharacterized protein n=1 Tax=Trypanosoma conorhini TaxID=83891 RepID=A0A422Q895_9TRYP|nr:uncharacterized protein Tco025E_01574 [Trypanosoma conorhini]RNF26174.1 hypothetical protein Tco025E_01574 [Trypanosoma conorhini]